MNGVMVGKAGASIVVGIIIIFVFYIIRKDMLKEAFWGRNSIVEKKSKRNESLKELTEEERKIIQEEIDSVRLWSKRYKGVVGCAIFQQIFVFCFGIVDLLISGPSLSTLFCLVLILAFGGLSLEATALVSQSEKEIEEKEKMLERKH